MFLKAILILCFNFLSFFCHWTGELPLPRHPHSIYPVLSWDLRRESRGNKFDHTSKSFNCRDLFCIAKSEICVWLSKTLESIRLFIKLNEFANLRKNIFCFCRDKKSHDLIKKCWDSKFSLICLPPFVSCLTLIWCDEENVVYQTTLCSTSIVKFKRKFELNYCIVC